MVLPGRPIDMVEVEKVLLRFGGNFYEVVPPRGVRYMSLPFLNQSGVPIVTWSGGDSGSVTTVVLERAQDGQRQTD